MDKYCCKRDLRSNGFYGKNVFYSKYNIDLNPRNAGYNDRKPMKKHSKDDYDYSRPTRLKKDKDNCCCKKELEKLFWFLFSPCVKDLIDQASINLISTFFTSDVTQIKRSFTCKELFDVSGTIHPSTGADVTSKFTTSFCDLIAIKFQLVTFENNACCSCRTVNQDTCFRRELLKILGCCKNKYCDIDKDNCCCNKEKATCLCNTIGPVNFVLNTTTSSQTLLGLTVIAVNDNIVVVFDGSSYYIICLNSIGAIF